MNPKYYFNSIFEARNKKKYHFSIRLIWLNFCNAKQYIKKYSSFIQITLILFKLTDEKIYKLKKNCKWLNSILHENFWNDFFMDLINWAVNKIFVCEFFLIKDL